MTTDGGATPVGFVGLGQMGWPMAARLRAASHPLVVLDRQPDLAQRFAAEHGGEVASSLPDLAQACDVVITMLPNGKVVRDVVLGDGAAGEVGLVAGLRRGSTVLDMSSSDPVGTRELGQRLEAEGIALVDAPVSGGVPRARRGELAILVGGGEADLERCRPLLEPLGSAVFHCGDLGSGHAMKALNNLLSAVGLLASAEVMVIGARFGLDPSTMLDVLNASSGRNNSTETKFRPYVLSGTYDSGFGLDLMVKDVRTALDIARATETPTPLSDEAVRLWMEAQQGLPSGSDHTGVARWVQERLGTSLEVRR